MKPKQESPMGPEALEPEALEPAPPQVELVVPEPAPPHVEAEALETPPTYVNCTPEQWGAAKEKARLERLEPFYWFEQPYAAASVDASMAFGGFIEPVLAAHFRDVIDAKGYKPIPSTDHIRVERENARRDANAKAYAELREKRNPFRFQSLSQASALLSAIEYTEYCLSQEGQLLMQRENAVRH